MKQFKAMKFWIGDNPELSKKVQEILFGLGYRWRGAGTSANDTTMFYIRTDSDGLLSHGDRKTLMDEFSGETIDVSWMVEERETITIGDNEYYKDELETALKNINPI